MHCVDSVRRNHDVSHSEVLKQVQNGPLICDLLTQATKQHCLSIHAKESCDDAPLGCGNSRTEMCTACPKGPLI
jgi:hypothetical protein